MRLNSTRTAGRALLAASLALLMGADEGGCGYDPILENNGFDLWCGGTLCDWEIEQGDIARVPTWHRADHGVELRGNAVAISQLTDIDSATGCLRFQAVANVAESTSVALEIDFFDDGTTDYSERIPTSRWEPVSFLITPPERYRGARFRIRKLGAGTAQLAEIFVEEADKCVEAPLQISDRPLGAPCARAGECASGVCPAAEFGAGYCAACTGDDDCAAGELCGLIEPARGDDEPYTGYRACQPAGADGLDDACGGDAECASGACVLREGVCATGLEPCEVDADCSAQDFCFRWGPPGGTCG